MLGIDPEAVTHKLNVDPEFNPVKQRRRKFGPERNQMVNEEVEILESNSLIREVQYPDWFTNAMVVKKKNVKPRVYINFTNLNKTFPKDSFPLPMIDILVDATVVHKLMSILDTYSGYNQILKHPDDQEKTPFMMKRWIYYYKMMPFRLKNAYAT